MNKEETKESIADLASELRWQIGDNFHDKLTEGIYAYAAEIESHAIENSTQSRDYTFDSKIDRIVTSKSWGFLIMIGILAVILWLTIEGANYPSGMLFTLLIDMFYPLLKDFSSQIGLV